MERGNNRFKNERGPPSPAFAVQIPRPAYAGAGRPHPAAPLLMKAQANIAQMGSHGKGTVVYGNQIQPNSYCSYITKIKINLK